MSSQISVGAHRVLADTLIEAKKRMAANGGGEWLGSAWLIAHSGWTSHRSGRGGVSPRSLASQLSYRGRSERAAGAGERARTGSHLAGMKRRTAVCHSVSFLPVRYFSPQPPPPPPFCPPPPPPNHFPHPLPKIISSQNPSSLIT